LERWRTHKLCLCALTDRGRSWLNRCCGSCCRPSLLWLQHFGSLTEASNCKLAKRLLKYREITSVFLGRDFVSVNKAEDVSWTPLRPIVLDAMMDAFAEAESKGIDIIEGAKEGSGDAATHGITDEDDEVVAMVKELIETRIRPAVQEDGGDIIYM